MGREHTPRSTSRQTVRLLTPASAAISPTEQKSLTALSFMAATSKECSTQRAQELGVPCHEVFLPMHLFRGSTTPEVRKLSSSYLVPAEIPEVWFGSPRNGSLMRTRFHPDAPRHPDENQPPQSVHRNNAHRMHLLLHIIVCGQLSRDNSGRAE